MRRSQRPHQTHQRATRKHFLFQLNEDLSSIIHARRLVSTWPKVLSLAPAGPSVPMEELYDWIRKNSPAVMQIQATPGTDEHSYGQLVKLLRDKGCVSHRCTCQDVL